MSFNPFSKNIPTSLGDLQAEMNHMFDRVWHGGLSTRPFDGNAWTPVFDVLEEEDHIEVVAEVPGVDAAGIELSFRDNRLTLKGERPSPWCEEAVKKLVCSGRRYGSFSRTIDLPAEIDPDRITAKVHNGVMTVTLGKVEQPQGKPIRVDAVD